MGPPGPHGMSHERGTVRNPCLHLHKAFASVLMWGVGGGEGELQFQVVEGKDYFNLTHSRTNQILGRETVVCHLYPSHPEMLHSLESVRAEEVVEHGQMDIQTDGQIDRQTDGQAGGETDISIWQSSSESEKISLCSLL